MTSSKALSVLSLLVVAACSQRKSTPGTLDDAGHAERAADAATTVAPTSSVVNLLLHSDAEVTLSSRVDNPRDYPEHLVDGKPQTAWNGKTGDLNAWVEVKLDPRVHVAAVEITAGFDKGDLFEKNLRIRKLRVERDGKLVRDAELDTNERKPQRIVVDEPGGTLKLTVLETLPGSNKAWKEIVVSELKVLGTAPPGALRSDSRLPKMSVAPGSAPPPLPASLQELHFEGREGSSLDAICTAWKTELLAVVKREQRAGHGLEGYDPAEVRCRATTPPRLEGTLPLGWSIVNGVELVFLDGVAMKDDLYLVLQRSDGMTVAGPMYSTANDIGDAPVPGFWRAAMSSPPGGPVLLLSYAAAWHSPYENSAADALHVEHTGRVCRFEATRFTCDPALPTVFLVEKLDGTKGAAFKAAPRAELPTIDPKTGTLRPWQASSLWEESYRPIPTQTVTGLFVAQRAIGAPRERASLTNLRTSARLGWRQLERHVTDQVAGDGSRSSERASLRSIYASRISQGVSMVSRARARADPALWSR